MSETVVTIHYQPAKGGATPRPTRLTLTERGNIQTTGGDRVLQGDQLIGLSRQDPAPGGLGHRIGSPPESFDPENWVGAEDILPLLRRLTLGQWFPTFMSETGEWIYTWSGAVDRVEVTVR